MKKLFTFLACVMLNAAIAWAQNKEGDLIIGNWQPSDERSVIEIYKGRSDKGEDPNKYYGRIVWLKEPIDPETGQPKVDKNNPDPAKRNTPLKGMVNLKDLEYVGDREWENGTIYDPKNGTEYSFYATLPKGNDNIMEARGYIGVSLFGRTDTWKRLVKK
ncbi:MAG: DUF2147 domain-containing protein [Flammeovirgaceae bacterium]|nr:DUF2147 domain-containing protein [Flammeovirgaceae bacterium]MDW8286880.1 DUF2147 domain-containing protein [Flammeovirgaceae bacterium]